MPRSMYQSELLSSVVLVMLLSPKLFAARIGEGAGQGGGFGLRGLKIVFPELGVAREADPDRPVRRPFGGDGFGHGPA